MTKSYHYLVTAFILLVFLLHIYRYREGLTQEPCSDFLSDKEYLLHMIPHHQDAVDISVLLQAKTQSPIMQEIIRKLLWVQEYEIQMMKDMLSNMTDNGMSDKSKMDYIYRHTTADITKPNKIKITDTECDPMFFDPEKHMEHMHHMELNDIMYIKHMIPHHQVAVDMSKKLLKHTTNDFMIYLAYRIIHSQQEEIVLLNTLLDKNNFWYQSTLLNN